MILYQQMVLATAIPQNTNFSDGYILVAEDENNVNQIVITQDDEDDVKYIATMEND